MIGVDYEFFWTLNPKSLMPFIKAFDLKQKYDDKVAWLNGLYVRMAILNSFTKNSKYPNNPLMSKEVNIITPEDKQNEIKRKFLQQVELINTRFEKGG